MGAESGPLRPSLECMEVGTRLAGLWSELAARLSSDAHCKHDLCCVAATGHQAPLSPHKQ